MIIIATVIAMIALTVLLCFILIKLENTPYENESVVLTGMTVMTLIGLLGTYVFLVVVG